MMRPRYRGGQCEGYYNRMDSDAAGDVSAPPSWEGGEGCWLACVGESMQVSVARRPPVRKHGRERLVAYRGRI
jgi:hypothetical protein